MARYQIILAYDGTAFAGSQRQRGQRTVQGVLEEALWALGWRGNSVLLAGRTDSGVHAAGQVAAFDLDWSHSADALGRALNAHLPADVAVQQAAAAADDFHPRFDAQARRYCYHLSYQPVRNPLRARYAWRVWPPLNLDILQQTAAIFLGRHDFSAFGTPPRPESSPVRRVFRSEWRAAEDGCAYTVEANAFLYRMVRRLVFAQVAVAQGRLTLDALQRALDKGAPFIAGLAPPQGLILEQVRYAPEK